MYERSANLKLIRTPFFIIMASLFLSMGEKAEATAPEQAECEAVVAVLGGLPGAKVTRSEGPFKDPIEGIDRNGCRVEAKGTFGALGNANRPEFQIEEALQARGLKPDLRYSADGMDGTAFALRNDRVLCLISGRWDGGDDSNPDYKTTDWYEISAGCAVVMKKDEPGTD
jgi:hypothetical protein